MLKTFRRFSALFVAIVLACAIAPASAVTFVSLSQLQQYIENHSPAEIMASGTHYAELEGTITEIHWCGANNHYRLTLQVEDDRAIPPIGSDYPQLTVHFRLHLDEPPFQVGDVITVFGSLNEMYSSVIVPEILAKTINGSEDF